MNYDLELSYIATILDEIPKLESPQQIRALCVDAEAIDPEKTSSLEHAKRVSNNLLIEWIEGDDEDGELERYNANLTPYNRHDNSEADYWQWVGEVTAKYARFDSGLHADTRVTVNEIGSIDGWMFENTDGSIFVGELTWDETQERERVVIELFDITE